MFTQVASLVCLSTLEYNNTTGENKTKIIVPIIHKLIIVNFGVQQQQAGTRRYKLLVVQCTCLHCLQQQTKIIVPIICKLLSYAKLFKHMSTFFIKAFNLDICLRAIWSISPNSRGFPQTLDPKVLLLIFIS